MFSLSKIQWFQDERVKEYILLNKKKQQQKTYKYTNYLFCVFQNLLTNGFVLFNNKTNKRIYVLDCRGKKKVLEAIE